MIYTRQAPPSGFRHLNPAAPIPVYSPSRRSPWLAVFCGRPADEVRLKDEPDWAPLTFTFAGFWEIEPAWVEEHGAEAQIVDVRDEDEYHGPLGHIEGARLIPLAELAQRADELSKDRPVITVCRAGARSAQGVTILKKAGFNEVANMAGGMLRWRAQKLPALEAID